LAGKEKDLKTKSRSVALVSVFAALDAVVRLIPFTPAIGLNLVFDFGWAFSPIMGMLLGAVLGFVAATLGSVILSALSLYAWTFGVASLFTFGVSALQAGLLGSAKSRRRYIAFAGALLLSLLLVWTLLVWDTVAMWVTTYYVVGVFAVMVLWWLRGSAGAPFSRLLLVETVLIAYSANITQHALGNILCVVVLNLKPEVFFAALPLTAIEQTVFALTAAAVAYPVLRVFSRKAVGISLGGGT
jgi:hypothetical protein